MYERLTFLSVALGGKAVKTFGDVGEVLLPFAEIRHPGSQVFLLWELVGKVRFLVGIEQVTVQLVAYGLVGNDQTCLPHHSPVDGQHSKIVEQAHEVVGVGDGLSRESLLQGTGNVPLLDECLDNGSVMCELPVLADEHPQLLIVYTDVLLQHVIRQLTTIADVAVHKV